MATTISYGEKNSGLQAGVVHGNVTIVQSETLNQECLRDLYATNPVDDKERIKNDKGGLLKDSYRWILDNKEFKQWQDSERNRLLWIRGDPGKGKTMLLCGVIEELTGLYGDNSSISFFFCQATDSRINSATSVLRGLIYLLVEKHPSLLHYVRARYDSAGKTLFEDVNAWNVLSTIFRDILNDPILQMTYLESSANLQIKWVVSSRNWPEITERFDIAAQLAPVSLELNEVSVSEAVNRFIQHKSHGLAKSKRYSDKTRDAVQRYLSANSQGTFLWVALVCQNLEKIRTHVLKKLKLFPSGLDALYGRMIDQVRELEDVELCKEILVIMLSVFRPITLHELTSLIQLPDDDDDDYVPLEVIIAICGSFLTLREGTVMFVYQSAKEYLLKEAFGVIFHGGIETEHNVIFSRSLDVIYKILQRDITNIKFSGRHTKYFRVPSPNLLAPVEYACLYWVDHLYACKYNATCRLSLKNREALDTFLQRKYLNWLEALSILGSLSDGIRAMKKLEGLIQEEIESVSLLEQVRDATRFIQYHRTGIENSPLQVYCSPLVFSLSKSLTRRAFQKERLYWVLKYPIVEKDWSACLQTLEGHSNEVTSIAWSRDGSRLASGSWDNTVRIWDPATGQTISTLKGHSSWVASIAWSRDGSRLASGSYDKIVRIWDPATGQTMSTLEGHSSWVTSIAWSRDGSRLASGSDDKIVQIWDPATGQISSTLEGHIRIWDPATGQTMSTLEGHSYWVRSIAWSRDGSRLASGSNDKTVRIWDPATSQTICTLIGHSKTVTSIAWSPDGSRLASGSWDNTVRIWDPATGQTISTLKGHSSWVTSITWSQDGSQLVSGSDDKTVRIWDPATGQISSTLEGHSNEVTLIAWSRDRSRLASGSNDKTIRIWDPATAPISSTLQGYSNRVTSIAWLQDGSRLASCSDDKTVRIWDTSTGQTISTLEGHSNEVTSIAWSRDGSRLASGSYDKTVRIWDPATAPISSTLEGHSNRLTSIAWSRDGSRLASGSDDHTVRIWDPATGQILSTLHTDLTSFLRSDTACFNRVYTSVGIFDANSVPLVTPMSDNFTQLERGGYGLSDDRSWITFKGLNLLWLPSEYRPASTGCFAIHATTIAIACSSKRVFFLELSTSSSIPSL
ncbi:hypothetical protein N7509_000527 [Penicillium cosmopolitanum]|uniref:NACHT domain-containing protein n=1 Tax=Penicillium cosmopolitanum TaxID=1131564 RepID=A0A9X0BE98_9EURO|nr:uncharacterized protein N7509_000527 [Penicillium cosmopolitanum]KAJ5413900.1 hypothetical protein N7509_000527 [Penicillium cosmopolitanum]